MSFKKYVSRSLICSIALMGTLTFNNSSAYADLGDQVLLKGMRNSDVKVLQQHLKDLGHFNYHTTTTYYGSYTLNAVKDFQRSNGLIVDGYFGPNSYRTLMKKINNSSGEESKISNRSNTNIKSTLQYNRVLKVGIKGGDVKVLQEALKSLGHMNIDNCTNYFGTITRQAVISFQKAEGILVDGYAGPQTIKTINNVLNNTISNSRKTITNNIINTAKKYSNPRVPYVFGGSSPSGFDCSGFTQYVYKQHNINIPRTTSQQANFGTRINKENLQPGDLVVFSNTYKSGPSHTGIYLGNDLFIHSRSSDNYGVDISNLNSTYYKNHFSYGRRVY
ncbi:C40 family peptidase [Clostridium sp. D2Q-14]|uniref:C40 family peptidase n=1 Tax=Anaeromonas gelatinilytica TaxID=2683194 RepID=UPI00193C63D8|nr:NlpC/P60 family protein [Anaeromonas gelatinilytica]MBS4535246.1 C40 family peptidase [Anaeromonas gelatinilytica]